MSDPPGKSAEDPLLYAEGAFKEHEKELAGQLLKRVQRDIPRGATVGEAIAEIKRAAAEDDDARELLFRIIAIQRQNPSGYLSAYFSQCSDSLPSDLRYQLAGPPFSSATLTLWGTLAAEIEERLPPYRTEAEREECVQELLAEDPRLRERVARLEELFRRDGYLPPDA